ncbi:hypothetical protein BCV70DRAFT_218829 [Testicularia cyperi]|uniref:ER membrane protein complex subunit 6 n=1 Tax=Testicularia cyperi TaxID=1882483 RepID=A0A317XJL8_9BASI|nr:hypothetical protein BCV70DRAFT_218829 [Testicularia cyperi]
MPPATRREVRLSASLPDQFGQHGANGSLDSGRSANNFMMPQMESILENFEQFKRKHISQNREIIKTNAVAQLRIRELENRVQALESEKVQQSMSAVGLKAQLSRLQYALSCIRMGWDTIGQGLALSPAPDAADLSVFPAKTYNDTKADTKLSPSLVAFPASQRVSVEPNPNAVGVVRPVAKAPEGHIMGLFEEDELLQARAAHSHMSHGGHRGLENTDLLSDQQAWQDHLDVAYRAAASSSGMPSYSATSTFDIEGAPSPMGSPDLPMDLEDAIAAAASRSAPSLGESWSIPNYHSGGEISSLPSGSRSVDALIYEDDEYSSRAQQEENRRLLRRSGRRSSRRQSGLIAQALLHDDEGDSMSQGGDAEPSSSSSYIPSSLRTSPLPDSEMEDAFFSPHRATPQVPQTSAFISTPQRPDSPHIDMRTTVDDAPGPLHEITNASHLSSASSLEGLSELVRPTPRKSRRQPLEPALIAKKKSVEELPVQEAVTPGGRKRKVPNHEPHEPMPTPARLFAGSLSEAAPSNDDQHTDEEPQTGRARRVRKSINYALPKLNTKMRKPDPSDLVPASTPNRSSSSTPAKTRGMIGSTGNLSDIRKLHEASASRLSPVGAHRNNASVLDDTEESSAESQKGAEAVLRSPARRMQTSAFWGADPITDTSDDDSRATSNADLGELAELEGAMSDLSTADEAYQVLTPRARQQTSSSLSAQMTASTSSDSMYSTSSAASMDGSTGNRRPSLRRKTTTLPTRSRQSSVEQVMETADERPVKTEGTPPIDEARLKAVTAAMAGSGVADGKGKVSTPVELRDETVPARPASAAGDNKAGRVAKAAVTSNGGSSSTATAGPGSTLTKGVSTGLVSGMKPKQRPASAGANLSSSKPSQQTAAANERPKTFSGATAASAGLTAVSSPRLASGSLSRAAATSNTQRVSLHSALTSHASMGSTTTAASTASSSAPARGAVTPRIGGNKNLAPASTPTVKESPRMAGTPILRPTLSTSSLTTTTASGRSSPALSVASTGSSGSHLSTVTRPSMGSSSSISQTKSRTGSNGTNGSASSSSCGNSTLVSTRQPAASTASSAMAGTTASTGARPQPAKSMPSLRKTGERPSVTSTPRITVRSGSSSQIAAGDKAISTAASTAASRSTSLAGGPVSTSLGLGIDFSPAVGEAATGMEGDLGSAGGAKQRKTASSGSTASAKSAEDTDQGLDAGAGRSRRSSRRPNMSAAAAAVIQEQELQLRAQSYYPENVAHNGKQVEYVRSTSLSVAGSVAGVLGLTNFSGFGFYMISVLAVNLIVLAINAHGAPSRYLITPSPPRVSLLKSSASGSSAKSVSKSAAGGTTIDPRSGEFSPQDKLGFLITGLTDNAFSYILWWTFWYGIVHGMYPPTLSTHVFGSGPSCRPTS